MSRNLLLASVCMLSTAAFLCAQDASDRKSNESQGAQNSRSESKTSQDEGQAAGRAGQTATTRVGQGAGQAGQADHVIASCIALGNQEEIALSELGRQKGQNEQVKKFAEMMVTEHQDFLKKLQRYAPEASRPGILGGGQGDQAGQGREGAAQGTRTQSNATQSNATQSDTNATSTDTNATRTADNNTTQNNANRGQVQQTGAEGAARTGAAGTGGQQGAQAIPASTLIQIERELANQCVMSAKQKLNQKDGAEFDQAFMGLQVAKHMAMKDKLTVYQRHASSELAQVLAEGLKTTDHHLQQAEQIIQTISQSGSGSGAGQRGQNQNNQNKEGRAAEKTESSKQ